MREELAPLWLCGDSHCLSAAWHWVTLRGHRRLLAPLLVTGCKIWHLRPASSFYPKAQFWASINALPRGAQLVLVLGEIDCREGLLLAVQKCKYGTLDEAMTATIDIYIALLTDLIASREYEIFVHPVPAVLNETRAVVRPFTAMLKQRVEAAARAKPALSRLHYLDFADALLTPDGAKLDPALAFDGTHLSPSYVRHLARELARV
ncbi:hypothetical protein V8C86DRAFT_2844258, partial [Haematococcus lacustris]